MDRTIMDDNQKDLEQFYKGLESLELSLYPKICNNCGRVYTTPESFLLDTSNTNNNGIKALQGEDGTLIVEVFRNCSCGSTLLSNFEDRRDHTESGKQRRLKFDALLDYLSKKGVSREVARQKIINISHGNPTNIKLNIDNDPL